MGSLRRLCGDGHRALYADPIAWASQPGRRLLPVDEDGEQWIERRRCLTCGEVLHRLCLVKVRYLDEPDPSAAPQSAPMFVAETLRLNVLRQQAVRLAYQQTGSLHGAAELLGVNRRSVYGWVARDPDLIPERRRHKRRPRALLLSSGSADPADEQPTQGG
ncbi:MAG: hypothetical protein U1A78_03670 [Polyangia bacterium]